MLRDTLAQYQWPHSVSWCKVEGYRNRDLPLYFFIIIIIPTSGHTLFPLPLHAEEIAWQCWPTYTNTLHGVLD